MTTSTTTPIQQSRHEAPDLLGAARRMVRGLVRRAAEGDTEALEALAQLEAELPIATTTAVHIMWTGARMGGNRPEGYSFTELGAVLGTTRQAARQRVTSGHALITDTSAWYASPKA